MIFVEFGLVYLASPVMPLIIAILNGEYPFTIFVRLQAIYLLPLTVLTFIDNLTLVAIRFMVPFLVPSTIAILIEPVISYILLVSRTDSVYFGFPTTMILISRYIFLMPLVIVRLIRVIVNLSGWTWSIVLA